MATTLHTYALTTLERVQAKLHNPASGHDDLLKSLINAYTDHIEKYCGRRFAETTHTNEVHDGCDRFKGISNTLFLKHAPISSITSLQYLTDRTNDTWVSYDTDEYINRSDEGIVELISINFPDGIRNVRATYVAGYAIDWLEQNNHDLPFDLTEACENLVIRAFNKRNRHGITDMDVGEDRFVYNQSFPKDIMVILDRYILTW